MDHQADNTVTSDLEKPHSSSADEIENVRPEEETSRICCKHCTLNFSRREVFDEVKNLISHSWLMSTYLVLNYGVNFAPIVFSGHLGNTELAAASLSVAVLGAAVRAVSIGFTSACETFFSQTYGSENKKRVGIELQRSVLCALSVVVLGIVICLNADTILLLLGQDAKTSAYAGVFLTMYSPGIPAEILCMVLVKYLQCQSILIPVVIILISVNVINVGCHFLFIYGFGLGFRGSPIALLVAVYAMVFHLLAYIYFKGIYKTTWSGWSWKCLEGWGKFYKLGIAGSLMVSFEWWSFEVGLFLAGLLGETAIGVQSVALHLISMAYMVPLGISIAASIRLGNNLGANKPREARLSSLAALLVCWAFAFLEAILFLSLRHNLGYIFTKDETIINEVGPVIILFALLVFFDNTACCCSGIVRGTGRQILGAVINFIGFYILGLPVSAALMFFTPLEGQGYWMGQTWALFAQSVMFAVYVCNLNWPLEAKRALKKAGMLVAVCTQEEETSFNYNEIPTKGNEPASDATCVSGTTDTMQEIPGDGWMDEGRGSEDMPNGIYHRLPDTEPQSPLQYQDVEVISSKESFLFLLFKRLLVLGLFTFILLVGIFFRIFIVHEGAYSIGVNDTLSY